MHHSLAEKVFFRDFGGKCIFAVLVENVHFFCVFLRKKCILLFWRFRQENTFSGFGEKIRFSSFGGKMRFTVLAKNVVSGFGGKLCVFGFWLENAF